MTICIYTNEIRKSTDDIVFHTNILLMTGRRVRVVCVCVLSLCSCVIRTHTHITHHHDDGVCLCCVAFTRTTTTTSWYVVVSTCGINHYIHTAVYTYILHEYVHTTYIMHTQHDNASTIIIITDPRSSSTDNRYTHSYEVLPGSLGRIISSSKKVEYIIILVLRWRRVI